MKFLLDANFLMIPSKFKVDILYELRRWGKPELYTLNIVIKELEGLSKGKGKDSRHARLALVFVKKSKVSVIPSKGEKADTELERVAAEEGFIVCTQDFALIERLKKEDIPVVFLRQGRYLERA